MRKIVILFLISGVLIGAFGLYYYQRNVYSKEVLKLEILGPEEVQAFDEIEYVVKYKNNGNTVLEEPVLTFRYPENSFPGDNNSKRLENALEDIYPGEEKTFSFNARIFGKENETERAEAALKYRPKNLKAFYESKTTFTTKIKFVPLTLGFDLPSKIESGKEFQFSLNYFSNSDWPLPNLRLKIEYPSGFEFIKSQPQALEKTEWNLPVLNKTEGGRIEVRGRVSGEMGEQKILKATLGLWREGEFTLLKDLTKGIELEESSLSIFQQINGVSQYTANAGDILHYEVFFRNLGEGSFRELFLVSKLEGRVFDFETIKTESGQFNKGDNSIVWDWRDVPMLQFLDQGEEGKVEFWINLKKDWQISSSQDKNLSLKNKVIISQISEEFETKISSKLEISQKGYYQDEIFGNSGPVPPKIGESTTYTIVWQAKNYYNDVKNVKVKAVLPREVKLTGKIFPEDSRLTFDSQSREIVWEIGDLEAGKGVLNEAPNVSFQVSLAPEPYQIGHAPEICGQAKISGGDDWTGKTLETTSPAIDTTLSAGQFVGDEGGIVQ